MKATDHAGVEERVGDAIDTVTKRQKSAGDPETQEWLGREIESVRWRQFFVFKRDFSKTAVTKAEQRLGPLPEDYVRFIQHFGEARLFRDLRSGSYKMAVFSNPRIHSGRNGESLLEIGFFINGGYAHLRKLEGNERVDSGVFEGAGSQVRKSADSFDEWLKKRFESSKKLYNKSEWRRIHSGAAPFNETELAVVEAMASYSFERVGVANNGNILIRVCNGSNMTLRYLTVGVTAVGRLNGAIYLDVSNINPGESRVIEHSCYKTNVPPEEIHLVRKPVPIPEEREMYWEFGLPDRAKRAPK